MAPRKGAGENSKKAAGQARKAEAAAAKQAEKDKQKAAEEDAKWQQGSKSNAKAEAVQQKAAEAARKKAERDALLAAEEATQPAKGKGAGSKTAQKKYRGGGLDDALLSLGGDASGSKAATVSASGIDNALDALDLDAKANDQVDRHPERRFATAYKIFEDRRLEEMKDDKTLRRQQKIEAIRKEFEKHPDNPFNQVSGKYNSTKEELREIADAEKKKTEARLIGQ